MTMNKKQQEKYAPLISAAVMEFERKIQDILDAKTFEGNAQDFINLSMAAPLQALAHMMHRVENVLDISRQEMIKINNNALNALLRHLDAKDVPQKSQNDSNP